MLQNRGGKAKRFNKAATLTISASPSTSPPLSRPSSASVSRATSSAFRPVVASPRFSSSALRSGTVSEDGFSSLGAIRLSLESMCLVFFSVERMKTSTSELIQISFSFKTSSLYRANEMRPR